MYATEPDTPDSKEEERPIQEEKKAAEEAQKATLSHPPSIDELPPAGVEGPLTKNPPPTLGGVTPEKLERSRQNFFPTFIEKSVPAGDRDERDEED